MVKNISTCILFLICSLSIKQSYAQILAAEPSSESTYIINIEGKLYTWGENIDGQLGMGDTLNKPTPQQVPFPNGVSGWTKITGGGSHSLALGNDGNLYSWGNNSNGQLGIGNQPKQKSPQLMPFPNGVTSWITFSGGGNHSLAIGNDGNLYSWGYNGDGELGIGNQPDQFTPQKVALPNGVTSWSMVTAGLFHSLAVGSDNFLYSWGYNFNGQLGADYPLNHYTPQQVAFPIGVTNWTSIACGCNHSLAIGNDGNLYTWGYNEFGQLGVGDTLDYGTPQLVHLPNGVTSWIAVSGGYKHSLAIGSDGNLYSWGGNDEGELGIGNLFKQKTPQVVPFPNGVSSWIAISCGYLHSLAVGDDGNLYAWGYNDSKQLGTGSNNYYETTPVIVSAIAALPVELDAFTATNLKDKVELQWDTKTEINNYGFEVERSKAKSQNSKVDSWEKIGFVAGSGNSNSTKQYSFEDNSNLTASKYYYRLKQIDSNGEFKYSKIVDVSVITSNTFTLEQNYPNPFNPSTVINYSVPLKSNVILKVYDILGKEVASLVHEKQAAGNYKVTFNASNLSSGIYIYKLQTDSYAKSMKMILLR